MLTFGFAECTLVNNSFVLQSAFMLLQKTKTALLFFISAFFREKRINAFE
jgi:hypothetical protein